MYLIRKLKTLQACVGFLLLAAGANATAQEDEPVDLETMQVTAGRQSESQYQVPQPVTVVTREQIEKAAPQVMTEALRGQPGAFFQQTGPGQGIVIVRGLKGAEVLHLVDGMRLNNAFFRTAPSQYIALLDPNNIEQLELVRGPYATIYGSDGMGGVVQVLTPEYRFASDGWDWQGGVRTHYASADLARVGRVYAATGTSGLSVSTGYSFLEYGKRKLAEPGQSPDHAGGFTLEDRVEDTDYLGRGYDFKTLWSASANQELMVSAQYFTLPTLPRYNETVPGFDTDGTAGPSRAIAIYNNDRTFYHLRYRYTAPLAFMDSLELHLAHQIINDDRLDRQPNNSRDTFEYNRSALSGLTAQAQSVLGAHRVLYGLELYSDRVDSRSVRETPPGSGTFTFNSASGFQSRFPDGGRADDYGVFALDEWVFAADWLLDAGLRYTYRQTDLPQADRAFGAKLDDQDYTGSMGLRYAITPALAWTINVGRGYRSPNINDLAQVGARANNRIVVANFDLKPESVLSLDTGLKFARGALQGEATLFYSDYRDRITLVNNVIPEGTGDCVDDGDATPEPCAQNRNIAQALYYGFEGGLRYRFSPAFGLRSVVNYTFGQQEESGVKTPGNRVPPLNGQLVLEYSPWTGVVVAPTVFAAGRQDRLDPADRTDSRINPNGTPGYAVVNLQLHYAALDWLDLQLGANNLFDKSYREHGSGIDAQALGVTAGLRARFD